MSNRDGKGAKRNKKHAFSNPLKKCPVCGSSLDKCDYHMHPGHRGHRYCKKCGYSNY